MKEGLGRERGKKGMGNSIFSLCVGKKGRVRIGRNERREGAIVTDGMKGRGERGRGDRRVMVHLFRGEKFQGTSLDCYSLSSCCFSLGEDKLLFLFFPVRLRTKDRKGGLRKREGGNTVILRYDS